MKNLEFTQNGISYAYDLSGYSVVLAHSGGCEKLQKAGNGKVTFWVYDGNKWEQRATPKNAHINKIKSAWKN